MIKFVFELSKEKINKNDKLRKKLQFQVDRLKQKVQSLESKMDVKSKENEKLKQELTEKSWTMVDSCVQPDLVQLKVDNVPIDSTVGDNNSITKDSVIL